MAEWSGFFDAHKLGDSWDRVYLAEDFAKFFSPLIGNGVFAGKSNELQVFQSVPAGMSVVLSSGQSWIEGYGYANDSDLLIPVVAADGALSRIDRIVNQWSAADRQIRTICKKGTPAVNPVAPVLRWDADYKELNLCILNIPAGTSAITQDMIKDTRADNSVCGWVTGLIDQVNTETLFAQWEAAYEKEFTEQKRAWENFFKDVQLDLGVPVPSPDKANFVLSVSPFGGYTLSDDYSSKEYADTRNPQNLLDNSDFTDPVNQREASSHKGSGYSIDRWKGSSNKTCIDIDDFSRYLTFKSDDGTETEFLQYISSSVKAGCEYTVMCTLEDGSVHYATGTASTDMQEAGKDIYVDDINLGTILFSYASTAGCYKVALRTSNTDGINVVNMALYRGEYTKDNLPAYVPKGYATEYAKCARYFQRFKFIRPVVSFTTRYTALLGVTVHIPMRIAPTVSIDESTITAIRGGGVNTEIELTTAVGIYPDFLEDSGTGAGTGTTIPVTLGFTPTMPELSSIYGPAYLYGTVVIDLSADL